MRALKRITERVADWFGGFTRIACPLCPMHVRYRGVDEAEEKRLRGYMADHAGRHRQRA
jgi:hypothetical protein